MASLFTSGPRHIWVGIGSDNAPGPSLAPRGAVYFGTGETGPDVEISPAFEDIMNDIGGNKKATERMYEGSDGLVPIIMTRWKQTVLDIIQDRCKLLGTPGFDPAGGTGTLMITEGLTYQLWVEDPYGTGGRFEKAAMAAAGEPPGHHFLAAYLLGPDRIGGGTRAKKIGTVFHCMRIIDPPTGAMKCYDYDMSALNGLVTT